MTCPDCERYKTSAFMWRNKAYETAGFPLPWDAEELIEKAVKAERERITNMLMHMHNKSSANHNYYKHAAVEINRNPREGEIA